MEQHIHKKEMMATHQDLETLLDELFSEFDRPDTPGCAIGVIKDGEHIYAKGFGSANLELNTPITPKTVFGCASISKQLTAMSIALLEEEGLLCDVDDIRLFLPELPDYRQTITVGNLVHMTNGLADIYETANVVFGVRDEDYFTHEQAWSMIKACPRLLYKPGERWLYGNTGYFLLAEIIKRVSGVSLAEFADINIFQPLNMKDTLFRDDKTMLIANRAEGYCDRDQIHYNDTRPSYSSRLQKYAVYPDNMFLPGAGGAWTNIEDLYKWDQNFHHNRLGKCSPELIAKVTQPARLNDGRTLDYGYGLFFGPKVRVRVCFSRWLGLWLELCYLPPTHS